MMIQTRELVAWCLLLWTASASAADSTTTPDEAMLGRRVAELFQVGFAKGTRALPDSQRVYESLRSASNSNPRLDYAYGLILLKQFRNKDAQTAFQMGTTRSGPVYRPAWEGLIWSHLIAKEFDDGFEALVRYARVTVASKDLTEDERRDVVYWIGRVMAASELTLDSTLSRESWLQTETKLQDFYGKAWIDAYHGGKEDVRVRHALLEDEIREEREKAKERQLESLGKKQDRLEKSLETAKGKRENLKKSANEMKENFEEQSTSYTKQLQRLEKDYAFLERRGMTLMTSMLMLDQQLNAAQQPNRNTSGTTAFQKLSMYQNQRLLAETEFQRVAYMAQQVAANAERVSQQRAEFLQQHSKATADFADENAALDKWRDRTLKQASVLKKTEAGLSGNSIAAKVQAVSSFRTYLDLDLNAERDKLLGSFGIVSDTK